MKNLAKSVLDYCDFLVWASDEFPPFNRAERFPGEGLDASIQRGQLGDLIEKDLANLMEEMGRFNPEEKQAIQLAAVERLANRNYGSLTKEFVEWFANGGLSGSGSSTAG